MCNGEVNNQTGFALLKMPTLQVAFLHKSCADKILEMHENENTLTITA